MTSHIWPLTNLYGSLSLFAAMSVLIFLVFAFRYDVWFIGGFVQILSAGFLAYALTWNEGYLPAVPALQSYWIKIHVPLVVSSYAAFMVAAVMSVLYLIKYYSGSSLGGGLAKATSAFATGGGPRTRERSRYASVRAAEARRGHAGSQYCDGRGPPATASGYGYRLCRRSRNLTS